MTNIYYRSKKADDLLLGDLYCDWALRADQEDIYGPSHRILNIKKKDGRVYVHLDSLAVQAFYPEQLVVVKEYA